MIRENKNEYSTFTDTMGYDKVLTNFDNIKQMSV